MNKERCPKNVGLIHPKIYWLDLQFFSFPTRTEQDHENQNILATNGRPRPFYRRTSLTLRQETTEITHQNPKSLVVNVLFDKCLAQFFSFLKNIFFKGNFTCAFY